MDRDRADRLSNLSYWLGVLSASLILALVILGVLVERVPGIPQQWQAGVLVIAVVLIPVAVLIALSGLVASAVAQTSDGTDSWVGRVASSLALLVSLAALWSLFASA